MLDRRFTITFSGRTLVFVFVTLIAIISSIFVLRISSAHQLEAKKAEYQRRMRFLNALSKASSAAGELLEVYDSGDAAFGIALQKAEDADDHLKSLAHSPLESEVVDDQIALMHAYRDCRGRLLSCDKEIEEARFASTKSFNGYMEDSKKFDPRTIEEIKYEDSFEDDGAPAKK